MNTDNGALEFEAYINNQRLNSTALEAERRIKGISNTVVSESKIMDEAFAKIGTMAGGYFGVQALANFGREIVNVRGEFQQLGIAFEVMLGSKEKADAMMAQQVEFAQKTPYTLTEVATNTKQLMAMGVATEDVMKTMKALGDVSAGVSVPISRVAINYGQVMTLGKLQGREIRDFAMAGIPIIDELAKMLGKTKAEILDMSEAGQISAQMTTEAFMRMSGEGGKFFNMMEKQNSSVTGQISNLQDKISVMFNEIGTENEGVIYSLISGASEAVAHYKDIEEAIIPIIAVLGSYKAALIAVSAVESMKVSSSYVTEAAGLEALMTAEQRANVSKLGLSTTSAEYVAALKSEIAANVALMQSELEVAQMQTASAYASHKVALQRALNSKIAVSQAQMELSLATMGGDVRQIELAQKTLLESQEERHIAVKARKATADALAIAKSKEQAISNGIQAATEATLTVANEAEAVSTNFLTAAKIRLTTATKALWATLVANPYALIAAAVIAIGYGIYKWATYATEAEKAQKELNSAIESETLTLEIMFDRLKLAKQGTDEYAAAKKAIIDKYGQYDEMLSQELSSVNGVTIAYNKLTKAVVDAAKARLREKYTKEATDSASEDITKQYTRVRSALVDKLGKDAGSELFRSVKDAFENGGDWKSILLSNNIDPKDAVNIWGTTYENSFKQIEVLKYKLDASLKEFNDIFTSDGSSSKKDRFMLNLTGMTNEELEKEMSIRNQLIAKIGDTNKVGKITGQGTYSKSELSEQVKLINDEKKLRKKANDDLKSLNEELKTIEAERSKIMTTDMTKSKRQEMLKDLDARKKVVEEQITRITGKEKKPTKAMENSEYEAAKDSRKLLLDLNKETADLLQSQQDESLQKRLDQISIEEERTLDKVKEGEKKIVDEYNKANKDKKGFKAVSTLADIPGEKAAADALEKAKTDVHNAYVSKRVTVENQENKKALDRLFTDYQTMQQKIDILKTAYDADVLTLTNSLNNNLTEAERKRINDTIAARKSAYEKELADLNGQILKSSDFYTKFFEDSSRKGYQTIKNFSEQLKTVISDATISSNNGQSYATISIPALDENGNQIKKSVTITIEEFTKLKEKLNEFDADLGKRNPFKKLADGFKAVSEAVKASEAARKASAEKNGGKVDKNDPEVQRTGALVGDALKEMEKGFNDSLAVVSDWGSSIGSILGEGFDESFKEIEKFVKGAGDIGFGIGKIASGDVIGGITQTLSGVAAVYQTITGWQEKQAAYQRKLYLGELQYQRALRDRNIELQSSTRYLEAFVKEQEMLNWLIKNGFVKEGSSSQYSILGQQYKTAMQSLKEEAKAYDDLITKIRTQGESDTGMQSNGSLSWERIRTTLPNATAESLKLLDAQGLLRGKTKEWYDAWVASGSKIEELTQKVSDLKDQMSGLTLGSSFDDFLSGVSDSLNSAQGDISKFADFTEETIKKALISSFKYQILSDAIKPFYDELSNKFMANFTGDTTIDSNWVKDWSDRLKKTMGEDWEKLQKIFSDAGISWADSNSKSGTLSGSIQNVSEETASVISGQMNAMRINQIESIAILRNTLIALNQIAVNTAYNKLLENIDKSLTKLTTDNLRPFGKM